MTVAVWCFTTQNKCCACGFVEVCNFASRDQICCWVHEHESEKKKEKKKRENKKHGCWLLSTKNTVIFAWNACAFYFYCCGEEQVNFYGHYIFAFTSIYFMLLVLVFPPSRRWERGGKRLLGILTYFSLGTMSALIKTRSSLLSAQRIRWTDSARN